MSQDRSSDPIGTLLPPPSPWVARFAPLVRPGGAVLDVACGSGRHLRLFHERGHPVVGIDIDLRGVADLAGAPGVMLAPADLEGDNSWPLPSTLRFAGIVVTNYLHRPLFPVLIQALEPGGVLLYETFARGNGRFGRPSSPSFLLRNGELIELAWNRLQIVAYEHGEVTTPKAAVIQRLVAVNDLEPAPDLDGDPEPRPLPTDRDAVLAGERKGVAEVPQSANTGCAGAAPSSPEASRGRRT